MADGSSTSPNKETVTLRLPSGEMVDAIVPAGFSDVDVKSYVRMKRPDLFGAPTTAASMPGGPQAQPQPATDKIASLLASRPYNKVGGFQGGPTQDMPGSTEGPGMMRGLAEYSVQGPGSMGQGAADLAQGNLARGGHELLSGAMNTLTPITPLVAPAAPGALIRSLLGGTAGGYLANRGAQAAGLTPDQQALVGDIGTLAGGYGGAKVTDIPVSRLMKAGGAGAKAAAGKFPIIGPPAKAAVLAAMKSWRGSAPPEPVYPGAPFPTATPEQINPALVSPSRTLPGMNPPEVIRPPMQTAQPIPPRSGLMLTGDTEPPVIPASKVSTTPPKSLSKADVIARARSIAQQPGTGVTSPEPSGPQTLIAGKPVPATADLTAGLKVPSTRVQGKIMQALREETGGKDLTVGIDRLMQSPKLKGISRGQVIEAAHKLGNSGKVWKDEVESGPQAGLKGISLRKP